MKNLLTVSAVAVIALASPLRAAPDRDAENYAKAIETINADHSKRPGKTTEAELAKKIPRPAIVGLARILKERPSPEVSAALVNCGEAALDLAEMDHFKRIRARLLETDQEAAAKLGDALARDRFIVRGFGELDEGYLDAFAGIVDAILNAYDEVFGFKEWSKVPGKKIRVRVHLEEKITRPPHFAPQYPWHSEIDMPVVDPDVFKSPTERGHMMFYGLCHEFGHLVAMWGDRNTMEDKHAWAHYTGVTVVEHMAGEEKYKNVLTNLRDARWRSLSLEKEKKENHVDPSLSDKAGVMALLIALHEKAGPGAIGKALNLMDEEDMGHRVNHVRYYRFEDLKDALGNLIEDRDLRRAVSEMFP